VSSFLVRSWYLPRVLADPRLSVVTLLVAVIGRNEVADWLGKTVTDNP
jgi:hypothetical protein